MDFEEWLWANNIKPIHLTYLRKCFDEELPVDEAIHQRMRELLHLYAIVGGMPEAVSTFLATNQIGTLLQVQRRIVDEYKSDMIKYALPTDKSKIRECFESIPSQLAKEYKNFNSQNQTKCSRKRICRKHSMDRRCRYHSTLLQHTGNRAASRRKPNI